ncbi:MAG: hypothetical protein IT233_09735 [Bacteroidia bacterium]|nr:hypothetical protein [Bacteroidia bacterium]
MLIPLLQGCSLFDKDEPVPAYISIPAIQLTTDYPNQGSSSHKIVDAWVYVDNNPVGTFELPAKFPVIATDGTHKITIYAGIKMNGISTLRIKYPFYDEYTGDHVLTAGQVTTITPTVAYTSSSTFPWREDFESAGHTFIDTFTIARLTQVTDVVFEGNKSGHVHLNTDTFACELRSAPLLTVPAGGRAVFLELNYKCSHSFNVGIVNSNLEHLISLVVNKSENWNKIYINLTGEINYPPATTNPKIYLTMMKPSNISTADFWFDNVKLVY